MANKEMSQPVATKCKARSAASSGRRQAWDVTFWQSDGVWCVQVALRAQPTSPRTLWWRESCGSCIVHAIRPGAAAGSESDQLIAQTSGLEAD
jgi:hypothetical protein